MGIIAFNANISGEEAEPKTVVTRNAHLCKNLFKIVRGTEYFSFIKSLEMIIIQNTRRLNIEFALFALFRYSTLKNVSTWSARTAADLFVGFVYL